MREKDECNFEKSLSKLTPDIMKREMGNSIACSEPLMASTYDNTA